MKKAVLDIKWLEDNSPHLVWNGKENVPVEFHLRELPNDMKYMCFLAGELKNSAHYFTTFANVNKDNANESGFEFGVQWSAWRYEDRVSNAKVVQAKVASEKKELKEATKLKKMRDCIRSLECRQKEVPLVERYVDLAKAEPLHMKNNVCKEQFCRILSACVPALKKKSPYKDLPEDCALVVLVKFVRQPMNCNGLSLDIKKWFDETPDKPFTKRFRGHESKQYLKHFPELMAAVRPHITTDALTQLFQTCYMSLLLRKVISYSVRITDFNAEDLVDCKKVCRDLFEAVCSFDSTITPSMWVLTNMSHVHAKITFEKYGLNPQYHLEHQT